MPEICFRIGETYLTKHDDGTFQRLTCVERFGKDDRGVKFFNEDTQKEERHLITSTPYDFVESTDWVCADSIDSPEVQKKLIYEKLKTSVQDYLREMNLFHEIYPEANPDHEEQTIHKNICFLVDGLGYALEENNIRKHMSI